MPPASGQTDPTLTPADYTASPVELDTAGARMTADNADRGNPFSAEDGSGWSGHPLPETRGKPRIRYGGGWSNRTDMP